MNQVNQPKTSQASTDIAQKAGASPGIDMSPAILLFASCSVIAIAHVIVGYMNTRALKAPPAGQTGEGSDLTPKVKLLIQSFLFMYLTPAAIISAILGYLIKDVAQEKAISKATEVIQPKVQEVIAGTARAEADVTNVAKRNRVVADDRGPS